MTDTRAAACYDFLTNYFSRKADAYGSFDFVTGDRSQGNVGHQDVGTMVSGDRVLKVRIVLRQDGFKCQVIHQNGIPIVNHLLDMNDVAITQIKLNQAMLPVFHLLPVK